MGSAEAGYYIVLVASGELLNRPPLEAMGARATRTSATDDDDSWGHDGVMVMMRENKGRDSINGHCSDVGWSNDDKGEECE